MRCKAHWVDPLKGNPQRGSLRKFVSRTHVNLDGRIWLGTAPVGGVLQDGGSLSPGVTFWR